MKLKLITCSGANEHTSIDALFALYQEFPNIEFGIQVSGKKCKYDSDCFAWLKSLKRQVLLREIALPLSLHINQDWVENFCQGHLVPELQEILSWKSSLTKPFFQRVQLNFKIGREKRPEISVLEKQMKSFLRVRFILSYNSANAALIREIYNRHKVVFDCLYDESFGEGIIPEKKT